MTGVQRWGKQRLRAAIVLGAVVLAIATTSALPLAGSRPVGAAPAPDPCGPVGARNAEIAGCQGTDAVLPPTASAMTASGHGEWSSMRVTVNQTANLVNQAVSVTWTGATPTLGGSDGVSPFDGTFGSKFVQIFQCWGDDDGSGGPPPEQCEYGGEKFGDFSKYPVQQAGSVWTRTISKPGWSCNRSVNTLQGCMSYSDLKANASADPATTGSRYFLNFEGDIVDPFRPVHGDLVPQSVDPNCCDRPPPWKPFNNNPYFDSIKTNEVDFARTYPDGSGQEFFQVNTSLEASGLGCGVQTQQRATGLDFPKCWLVVVPRGGQEENTDGLSGFVTSSPMTPMVWGNRIAFPLSFTPIGQSCSVSGSPRRLLGGELAAQAVGSWQPALCSTGSKTAYNYGVLSEGSVRSTVAQGSSTARVGVITRPIDKSLVDPRKPLVYAPLTLSGAVIGLNIQRLPLQDPNANGGQGGAVDLNENPLYGKRVTRLNLTPRLIAKLLTESYLTQFLGAQKPPQGDDWAAHNPVDLVSDPEFLKYNPEFRVLSALGRVTTGGLVVEEPSTDTAYLVWQWILADPEAKAWLDGEADPAGMRVNPYYSTSPQVAKGQPLVHPETFPKSDPFCELPDNTPMVGNPLKPARQLCFQDWDPYMLRMQDVATAVRSTSTGSRTTFDGGATSPNTAWKSDEKQQIGQQFVLGLTDSASAARYGLQTASLSRAGDDSEVRSFVAPDAPGLLAGVKAMTKSSTDATVLEPDPATKDDGAYPLTMLTYAVGSPSAIFDASGSDDPVARADYANLLTYAAGPGQVSGTAPGQLPPGYVALPADLAQQTASAAAAFAAGPIPPTTTTTTAVTTTTPPTTMANSTASPTTMSSSTDAIQPSAGVPVVSSTTLFVGPPPAPARSPSRRRSASKPSTAKSKPPSGSSRSSSQPRSSTPTAPAGGGGLSPVIRAGIARWALPFTLVIGLVAGVCATVLRPRRRLQPRESTS